MNRGLNITQTFVDTYQRPIQTVRQFDIYLTSLETQFFYVEKLKMFHLFAKLKLKIHAIIVNNQTVPRKRNDLLSLNTRLENNFYKTQPNSSRGNRNDHFYKKNSVMG